MMVTVWLGGPPGADTAVAVQVPPVARAGIALPSDADRDRLLGALVLHADYLERRIAQLERRLGIGGADAG